MARTGFQTVNDYIASHPREVQAILRKVRAAARAMARRARQRKR